MTLVLALYPPLTPKTGCRTYSVLDNVVLKPIDDYVD